MGALITNSQTKHALAAVRALGRSGIEVHACSELRFSPTKYSKYCKSHFTYPSPRKEREFVSRIIHEILKRKIRAFIPIGYWENIVAAKYKKLIKKYTGLYIADYSAVKIAADKKLAYEFLSEIGVRIPKTIVVESLSELRKCLNLLRYPVVIKSRYEGSREKVSYAANETELITKYKIRAMEDKSQLIQEYIDGDGYGFFALIHENRPIATFQHRRIREYPSTGGVSSFAESVYDKELQKIGIRILRRLKWMGVAMVEFRRSREGEYYVLEINPKFWGSLDLAISCGINFPLLLYKIAIGERVKPITRYEVGKKFQWLLPEELLHIRTSKNKLKAAREVLMTVLDNEVDSDLDFDDPIPTLIRMGWSFFRVLVEKGQR